MIGFQYFKIKKHHIFSPMNTNHGYKTMKFSTPSMIFSLKRSTRRTSARSPSSWSRWAITHCCASSVTRRSASIATSVWKSVRWRWRSTTTRASGRTPPSAFSASSARRRVRWGRWNSFSRRSRRTSQPIFCANQRVLRDNFCIFALEKNEPLCQRES